MDKPASSREHRNMTEHTHISSSCSSLIDTNSVPYHFPRPCDVSFQVTHITHPHRLTNSELMGTQLTHVIAKLIQ